MPATKVRTFGNVEVNDDQKVLVTVDVEVTFVVVVPLVHVDDHEVYVVDVAV